MELTAYSCGGSHGFGGHAAITVFPFNQPQTSNLRQALRA
jgi:hypothetical protein